MKKFIGIGLIILVGVFVFFWLGYTSGDYKLVAETFVICGMIVGMILLAVYLISKK